MVCILISISSKLEINKLNERNMLLKKETCFLKFYLYLIILNYKRNVAKKFKNFNKIQMESQSLT